MPVPLIRIEGRSIRALKGMWGFVKVTVIAYAVIVAAGLVQLIAHPHDWYRVNTEVAYMASGATIFALVVVLRQMWK